jgi:energy-coupling factor transporter ATP-binding protein EcfA2
LRPGALDKALRTLKLSGMLATIEARLAQARAGELGHIEFLQVLCEDEISRRQATAIHRRLRSARFEEQATLEGFDFTASPKLPAAQIRDLAALRWLHAGESVILYGPVGVGKSHVAQALGHLAIRHGSGKTTVSDRICAAVPAAAVVRTDDVAWQHSILGWTDLLADGVLRPLHRGEPVNFRPPAWRERSREGAIEVPAGRELVMVEGVGAARRELMALLDVVVWVQSDMVEAERRGIERDGGDEAAVSFWHLWMAEELPFMEEQRPWERAAFIVAGTPLLPHDPASQVVIAGPIRRPGLPPGP